MTAEAGRTRSVLVVVAWVSACVVVAGALAVGGLVALLYLANPVGDEWACSQGESPAGRNGLYSQCFEDGSDLPAGFTWDPLGNRPLANNCDRRGWELAEQTVVTDGVAEVQQECVRNGTDLPLPTRIVTTVDDGGP